MPSAEEASGDPLKPLEHLIKMDGIRNKLKAMEKRALRAARQQRTEPVSSFLFLGNAGTGA